MMAPEGPIRLKTKRRFDVCHRDCLSIHRTLFDMREIVHVQVRRPAVFRHTVETFGRPFSHQSLPTSCLVGWPVW